jgi:hypothetical protein
MGIVTTAGLRMRSSNFRIGIYKRKLSGPFGSPISENAHVLHTSQSTISITYVKNEPILTQWHNVLHHACPDVAAMST